MELEGFDVIDSVSNGNDWLKSQNDNEDSQLMTIQGTIACAIVLFKIVVASVDVHQHNTGSVRTNESLSEEVIEKSLHLVLNFLKVNFLTTIKANVKTEQVGIATSTPTTNSKQRGKGKSAVDTAQRKVMVEMVIFLLYSLC